MSRILDGHVRQGVGDARVELRLLKPSSSSLRLTTTVPSTVSPHIVLSLLHGSHNYKRRCVYQSTSHVRPLMLWWRSLQVFGKYVMTARNCFPPTPLMVSQNTEDEVLKAAIAKYGKNQWHVLSVLHIFLPL